MMGKTTSKNTGKKSFAAIAANVISVASFGFTSVSAETNSTVDVAKKTAENVTTEEYVDNVKLGHFYDSKGNVWEFQKHFSVPVGDPNLETALKYDCLEQYYMGCGVTVRKCTCEEGPKFVLPYEGLNYFDRQEVYGDTYIEIPSIDDLVASTRGTILDYIVHKIDHIDFYNELAFMSKYDYYPDYKINVADVVVFNKGYNNAPWCYIQTKDPVITYITINMSKDEFMSIMDSHEGEDEFFIGLNDASEIALTAANMVELAQVGMIPEKVISSFE